MVPPGPPFDGVQCPACPVEIRNLAATAHNLLNRYDDIFKRPAADPCDWPRFHRKMEDLRAAVAMVKPLVDAHFADAHHARGVHRESV